MNRISFALLLVAASAAQAQQGVTRLQCDGTYSDYVQNIRDVPTRGVYLEIRKGEVKVYSVPAFGTNEGTIYRTNRETEASVCFILASNDNLYGCVNRFSGEINLMKQSTTDKNKMDSIFLGNCRTAKPLF
ncbi:MAG: hypothetical protein A3G41_05855 [Elusimicrobia bacterium RIFCSPLOWO2_12_FULL_59_9]|nr:MAG: hypothetical protein A3G41_05855 [Elusimicrobia bacterium RIFCSPLOWO2_12_FULL_59_9]